MFPTNNIFLSLALLLVTSSEVWGHGTITGVTGANGVQAAGFGIIASTPRDGTTRRPFQQDTSIIRDREITSGKAGVCGRTLAGGNNDVQSQLTAAVNAGLPSASSTGALTMTLHQINGDGAGPYTCDVSTDGGVTFNQAATVTTNVPGNNGRSRAKATDFPLVMQVSPTTACTGGPSGNACVARCRNPAAAGPFGSCVAFTMGSNATATDSATVSSTESAAASNTTTASSTESTAASNTTAASSTESAVATASVTASVNATSTEESSAVTSSTEAAVETTAVGGTSSSSSEVVSTDSSSIEAAAATSPGSAAQPAATGVEDEDEDEDEEDSTNDTQSPENGQNAANTANTTPIKRMINSRIAGRMAGHWIDV